MNVFENAIEIINIMEHEQLPVRAFLSQYSAYFANVDLRCLIPPECRESDKFTESAYIFVIGSYLYQRIEGKPVTWFERRRFADRPHYDTLFRRTLCSNPNRRFQRISELKQYLKEVEKSCEHHSNPEQLYD